MKNCSHSVAPILKGDRFDLNQCSKNDFNGNTRRTFLMLQILEAIGMLKYVPNLTLYFLLKY